MLRRLTKILALSLALVSFGVPASVCAKLAQAGECCPTKQPAPCGECPSAPEPVDPGSALCSPAPAPAVSATNALAEKTQASVLASGAPAMAPPPAAAHYSFDVSTHPPP